MTSWDSSSCIAGSRFCCSVAGRSGSIPSRNGCEGGGSPSPCGSCRSPIGGRRRSGSCLPKVSRSGCSLSETTTVAEHRLYLSPSRGPDQTTLSFNPYALPCPFSPIRLTSLQFPEPSAVIAVFIVVIDLTPCHSANDL